MHSKTMEGLVGAKTNMNMLEVPMRIYRQAERRGDLGAMERAGEYITDFAGRKDDYRKDIEEGMELERKEREKEEEKQKEQGNSSDAASLEISEEGKEAWMRAAESASGEEEVEHEN